MQPLAIDKRAVCRLQVAKDSRAVGRCLDRSVPRRRLGIGQDERAAGIPADREYLARYLGSNALIGTLLDGDLQLSAP